MKVLIVGGGPLEIDQLNRELAERPDLIIAADSGGKYLREIGCLPHILMGDFDSLDDEIVKEMGNAGVELISYPIAKDQTDLELALDLALAQRATTIRILGGMGERLDHTLGNIGLLLKAYQQGVAAYLIDSKQEAMVIGRGVELKARPGWGVSLIPLTLTVSGVTTTGLKFPLTNAELYLHETRGIHNEYIGETAVISLKEGLLLLIIFQEKKPS